MTQNRISILDRWKQHRVDKTFLCLVTVLISIVSTGTQGVAQDLILDMPSNDIPSTLFEKDRLPNFVEPISFDFPELPIVPAETIDLVRTLSASDQERAESLQVESNSGESKVVEVGFHLTEILPVGTPFDDAQSYIAHGNGQQSCELNSSCNVRPWIFWKNKQCSAGAGPVCCSIQKMRVNWRLSSMYLEGCMPAGYSLQRFIETVNHLEFHPTMLSSNGPVDQGGEFDDALKIEGTGTKAIQQISINITPPQGELPPDRARQNFNKLAPQIQTPGTHRSWSGTSFYWQASLLNHQPLYFEDVNLERHGFSHGLMQPLISGGLFFSRLPALPYLMAAQPPYETQFTLGETRPGNHACYVCERPPLRLKAAAVQAVVVTGLVFLIP